LFFHIVALMLCYLLLYAMPLRLRHARYDPFCPRACRRRRQKRVDGSCFVDYYALIF